MEKNYLLKLEELKKQMNSVENSQYTAFAKVTTLAIMNMRYERVAFDLNLKEHPYEITDGILGDALKQFDMYMEAAPIIDGGQKLTTGKSYIQEEKHEELFNEIWDKYNEDEFQAYIDRYKLRINHNEINELIQDKVCIDFGCGNGVFCFALIEKGAQYVVGIDYGKDSIDFARKYSQVKEIQEKEEFQVATVYDTGFPSDHFDFALQNGVFHHTDNENKAIEEVKRVLKKDGWLWYYTEGEGAISTDLWDMSVEILKDVSVEFIHETLEHMGIRRGKIVHLMDVMSATYRHTSWNEITERLATFGFGNFKRLSGATNTDYDLDVIEKDPFGREKFGEGDLRVLCQLFNK